LRMTSAAAGLMVWSAASSKNGTKISQLIK
jgi:hypothetical protein